MLHSYRHHIKNTELGIATAVCFQEFNSLYIRSHQHFGSSLNISATGHTEMKLFILDSQGSQRMTPSDISEYMSFPLVQGSHWMPKPETENRAESSTCWVVLLRCKMLYKKPRMANEKRRNNSWKVVSSLNLINFLHKVSLHLLCSDYDNNL